MSRVLNFFAGLSTRFRRTAEQVGPEPVESSPQSNTQIDDGSLFTDEQLNEIFDSLSDEGVITSGDLMLRAGIQAQVNGVPTYALANNKHDLEVMVACVEAEVANYWNQRAGRRLCAAPFYFQRAAILYRKKKQFSDEMKICESWLAIIDDYEGQGIKLAAKVHLGPTSVDIVHRLTKARELLAKSQTGV